MKEAKKLFLFLFGTALLVIIAGMLNNQSLGKPLIPGYDLGAQPQTTQKSNYKKITVSAVEVDAMVADDANERRIGLSQTSALYPNEGMLFYLDKQNSYPAFWMKDMEISIDIIWINDGKIVQIDKDVNPEPGKADSQLTLYKPQSPVDYVLEMDAGWSDENNIKVGDSVDL